MSAATSRTRHSGGAFIDPRLVAVAALTALAVAAEGYWAIEHREALRNAPPLMAGLPMATLVVGTIATTWIAARALWLDEYRELRVALSDRRAQFVAAVAVAAYVPLFFLAQDAVQRVPGQQRFDVMTEGAPGITPVVALFPVGESGVVLGAFQIAALSSLALPIALTAAALTYLVRISGARSLRGGGAGVSGIGGAGLGLLTWCPTCIATPVITFVSSYFVPILALPAAAQTVTAAATYALSLLLVVIALDAANAALRRGGACDVRLDSPSQVSPQGEEAS